MAQKLNLSLESPVVRLGDAPHDTHVVVPEGADVRILWSCSDPASASMRWDIGRGARCVLDIADRASLPQNAWVFELSEGAHCVVQHACKSAAQRRHHVEVFGAHNSVMDYRMALMLEGDAEVEHRLDARLSSDRQQLIHTVHGVALGRAQGRVLSYVSLPKGAHCPDATQMLKAFAPDGGSWILEPDLVVEHDAVSARHGAAFGMIPEAYQHYARTRGLSSDVFDRMYYEGFLRSVFSDPSEDLLELVCV